MDLINIYPREGIKYCYKYININPEWGENKKASNDYYYIYSIKQIQPLNLEIKLVLCRWIKGYI